MNLAIPCIICTHIVTASCMGIAFFSLSGVISFYCTFCGLRWKFFNEELIWLGVESKFYTPSVWLRMTNVLNIYECKIVETGHFKWDRGSIIEAL